MKEYCITMERTLRISKWFEAENDEEAIELANKIYTETADDEYEDGSIEHLYALSEDNGRTVVDWDR